MRGARRRGKFEEFLHPRRLFSVVCNLGHSSVSKEPIKSSWKRLLLLHYDVEVEHLRETGREFGRAATILLSGSIDGLDERDLCGSVICLSTLRTTRMCTSWVPASR